MTGEPAVAGAAEAERARGGWIGDELQRARARVDELTHELARVQAALAAQQAELVRLHESLALLDGRTRRHEAGQDAARELRQELGALAERSEAEAELRRQHAAVGDRRAQAEHEQLAAAERGVEQLAAWLAAAEQHLASDGEQRRRLATDLGAQGLEVRSLVARVEALEEAGGAERDAARATRDERARALAQLPELRSAVADLAVCVRGAAEEHRRLEDAVAALRAARTVEGELRELVEQQRATRQRVEQRFAAVEETLEQLRRDLTSSVDERLMLHQQAGAAQNRLRALAEALEAQRLLVLEQFRRWTEVELEAGRREVDEIERSGRRARELLVRFAERIEQPPDQPAAGAAR
ncbi:MAG: hypothetical protein EXR65_01275 [Dehalococcoidia bacterium]|nr:hypothetical protein [Dehalococcoidia bacterium]